jgi:protein TonB
MSTILAPSPDETRLVVACLAASVALHGAALAISPLVRHPHELELPRVLSVVLPEPAPAAEETPPPPPPRPVAAPPRPKAPSRVAPVPEPRAEAPRAAPVPAEASPAPPAAAAPAKEDAPAAPSTPVVAAASREPSTPPDFRAAYLRNPPPGYPAAARRNGEEGTVTLRVLVSAEGAPREVALERSSGSSLLDAAALATVKTWRFSPARRGGEAQEAWVLVPIVFRLEPRG